MDGEDTKQLHAEVAEGVNLGENEQLTTRTPQLHGTDNIVPPSGLDSSSSTTTTSEGSFSGSWNSQPEMPSVNVAIDDDKKGPESCPPQGTLVSSSIDSSIKETFQPVADKLAALPIQRSNEGLSSLVSYSSSSAEASASEDNAQEDLDENSLPELPESYKETQQEDPKTETEPIVEETKPVKELEEPMEVEPPEVPEIQETDSVPIALPEVQEATEAEEEETSELEALAAEIQRQEEQAAIEKESSLIPELPDEPESMEVGEDKTSELSEVTQETKAQLIEQEPTPEPDEKEPEEVLNDPAFDNEEKVIPVEEYQEEMPCMESEDKTVMHEENVKSPAEEDGETCTLKLSSDESTGLTEAEFKEKAQEEKKDDLDGMESSGSETNALVETKETTVPEGEDENTFGVKLKRALDEEIESAEEPVSKRVCMEEMPVSSASFEGKILERQNTLPFEPETEGGATVEDQLIDDLASEDKKDDTIQKSDEESRDDMSIGEKMKEMQEEKLDSKEKIMKEEEEEIVTPSTRRKRKKKSYERPRGEGGKFRKEKPDPSVLDEDTRMDSNLPQDEDSQGSMSKREVRRFRCEVIVPESTEAFTAEKVVEYVWPLEGLGEHYFIQEQISQYLGIMSFKRKYPDLRRRPIDMQERDYLKEKGLVSEMACDLGLTAVRSEDVLDVMFNDFPSKFDELQRLLRERKENEMKERGKVNYSMANIDKSKMQEYGRKAAADAARWNAAFNKEKRDERRYSFDLQTFSLQKPSSKGKKLPPEYTKIGPYPVAVLPGQFTDYYREYTSAALSSLPLNSVMAPPITRDPLGSDGAGSDSEEEASVPTQGTDEPDNADIKDEKGEGLPRCKVCSGTKNRNKGGKPEPLIICGSCRSASHPTCIDLTLAMVPKIESYNWQCMDCKNCVLCSDPDDEEKMIFCDMCDRGYHIYCVGLRRVPNGRWHCKECAICSSCGSKTPAGNEHAKNAEWQHEFKKDKDNKQLKYATTLCVPCDKYWKRRQFCYVCLKVYRSIPEDGMVRCSNCPKYIHREGCSTMYENERFCNNCFKMRNTTALNHSRIIAAAKKKMASGY
ncbi:transcription initiation factor TFIID subunit 3-like isoform X2 [Penaeus chinensis]|uniref:transcription initiation factor TFIID subunit 3-like isoform X2 n=1 Tax=Penaeus chinensis TaxID=139456 RepID=UPI001FB574DD|nr:transcription initiation factor TFIID subunit 3-like isoform X2 [Penaeus chinensis]